MRRIVVDYDHYMGRFTFDDGEKNACEWLETRLGKDGRNVADWAGDFLGYLKERYNDSMELVFTGIQQDCEAMEDAVAEFNKAGNVEIRLTIGDKGGSKTGGGHSGGKVSLDDLRGLYEEVNSIGCPIDELRGNKKIEDAFRHGTDKEFEMAVVATMSSGKSTLINALLGQELLPARHAATTATITRIHDRGNKEIEDAFRHGTDKEEGFGCFFCKYVDKGGTEQIIKSVSKEDMNRLNDEGINIDVYGKMQGIDTHALNLVLTDTPGPNNSRTEEHKALTYRLIQDSKFKPMILYVLNATQLETMDDYELLGNIANAMKSGGRQASERFIFVMNKADEFDTEKESVERMMERTKDYLSTKHGIKNPKLFPCSAYFAKLIRQAAAGEDLTKKEKIDLHGQMGLFIEDEGMHLSSKATVSEEVRGRLERRVQVAKERGDNSELALIHTGIPAVEEAINEYLEKYAVPAKIDEALRAFRQIIKDTGAEAKASSELAKNTQEREKVREVISSVSKELEQGDKAEQLKGKVDKLSVTKEVKAAFEQFSGERFSKFSRGLADEYKSSSAIPLDKVEGLREKVNRAVADLQGELAVDLENIINHEIGDKAQELVESYNKYVEELMGTFSFAATPAALVGHLAHMRDLTTSLDSGNYEFEREEVVGTRVEKRKGTRRGTKTREETRKEKKEGFRSKLARGFGKLFRKGDWGYEYKIYEVPYEVEQTYEYDEIVDVKDKVKYVDFSRMVKDFVASVLARLSEEARKLAFEEAEKKAAELKQAFKNEFDRLNKAMKKKLAEKERSLKDAERFQELIEQGNRKLAWIKDFEEKLRKAIGC
ncbi:MAG: dynamin family protein [Spirochaetaceae bacterium]|nr:dynamin family protein [Spirochaetaceae bacterium]